MLHALSLRFERDSAVGALQRATVAELALLRDVGQFVSEEIAAFAFVQRSVVFRDMHFAADGECFRLDACRLRRRVAVDGDIGEVGARLTLDKALHRRRHRVRRALHGWG